LRGLGIRNSQLRSGCSVSSSTDAQKYDEKISRVSPRAAEESHPPLMKGSIRLRTCCGVRTISKALGMADPAITHGFYQLLFQLMLDVPYN
jgi:hypothetical protein